MGGLKVDGLYIPVMQVALVCEWCKPDDPQWKKNAACRRAKSWLEEADALVTINGRNYTTRDRIKRAFPDVWDEYEMRQFERDE